MSDRMVSTAILRQRRDELRKRIAEQKAVRADNDPFFKHTAWLLAEWEAAERDAALEYVSTSDASRLTGWSEPTLRARGQAVREGRPLPPGWEDLRVRTDGRDYAYCVSTIPIKSTRAA